MNELMREEILDQPLALATCLPSLRRQVADLALARSREVVFTGSGDSFFAPLALQYAARVRTAATVRVMPAMECAHYFAFASGSTAVVISVSGEARRTLEAARAAAAGGARVLAITAIADSTLAELAERTLLLDFRSRSRKTPHTTDFATTLLAVAVVVESLSGRAFAELDAISGLVGGLIESLEAPARELGARLGDRDRFYFLGAGPSFAIAQYAAEKFWEAGGLHAYPFELEEFAHGPHLLVERADPVFVIAPSGKSLGRALEIGRGLHEIGADVYALSDAGDDGPLPRLPLASLPEELSPFATSIAVQWLCWAIATAKAYDVVRKDGRHTDAARYERVHERWVRG